MKFHLFTPTRKIVADACKRTIGWENYFQTCREKDISRKNRYPLFYIIYPGLSPAAPSDMAPSPQKPHPERIAPLRENAVTPVEKTHRGAPIKRSKWHLGNKEYIICSGVHSL